MSEGSHLVPNEIAPQLLLPSFAIVASETIAGISVRVTASIAATRESAIFTATCIEIRFPTQGRGGFSYEKSGREMLPVFRTGAHLGR